MNGSKEETEMLCQQQQQKLCRPFVHGDSQTLDRAEMQ